MHAQKAHIDDKTVASIISTQREVMRLQVDLHALLKATGIAPDVENNLFDSIAMLQQAIVTLDHSLPVQLQLLGGSRWVRDASTAMARVEHVRAHGTT
jgi:hypothetical protein